MTYARTSGGIDDVGEMDDREVHLLGQRLRELPFIDQVQADRDLAEQFVGTLLLLVEQHFELILVDESEVHQDLADLPNCHLCLFEKMSG